MRRYQTSIKVLMEAKNNYQKNNGCSPVFLSDWDSDYGSIRIPVIESAKPDPADLCKYYFWTDEGNFRAIVQEFFFHFYGQTIPNDCFAIGTNGTSSIMLALTALKESGKQHVLVVAPAYFSTLNLLDELNFDATIFKLSAKNEFKVDLHALENAITNNHADILAITLPIFGSGIEIDINTVKEISEICNRHEVCFLVDYIYGGLLWDIPDPIHYIFNFPMYEAVRSAEHYVFIESISKRIFLNGAKFALVFSTPNLMRRILRLSVFMTGSMALQQVSLIPQIYSIPSAPTLSMMISETADTAYNRYRMVNTLLADTNFQFSAAHCGYFAILSIPKLWDIEDLEYATTLLEKTGVLTTPHSRYLLKEEGVYSFRVNLLLEQSQLLRGITRIKNLK